MKLQHRHPFVVLGVAFLAVAFTPRPIDPPMLGFTAEGAAEQRELESQYDALLKAENLSEWMQLSTSEPIYVGSPHNREMADWMVEQFRSWGYEAELAEYHVLFPTPRIRELELLEPTRFTASLREPTLAEDRTSGIEENRLPTYNAYSADGDVSGELVYVNYGIPDDYEELERRGIDVRGKIVIARYGGSWRGIKPKVAHEHGALGVILYSDPRDDGYFRGDVYPEGPYRMEGGVQRGSVLDMPQYPGDPLTPMVGATADAERLSREESPTLMKIPVLPISYSDALPFLQALEGPVAPAEWRGALPITYHLGPGPAQARLHVEFNWDLKPAYNVIARVEGAELPDEWVVRGNHRDGWAIGAADPTSGMVALLEEARAVGELMKTGWRPKRTIVYAGWDAEEPALLGSTEWAEDHARELREKAAIYLNTDGSGRGFLRMGGSHTLEFFINQVARDVTDPQTGVSVWERARAARAVRGSKEEVREEALSREELRISPLGSGSDYTPFLQHLGIASLHLGFGGENSGGSYHSMFDSFDHYTRFGDPGFVYGVALAKTAGRVTLRFANADVLPFQFGNFADNVSQYLEELTELADEMREETERENRLIKEKLYVLAADPTKTYHPPEAKQAVPYLNFAPVQNALSDLEGAAAAYDKALAARMAGGGISASAAADLNQLLISTERLMTREEGLPRRPWFRHQIYAPGFYTGYGVKTLPGIREAIEERKWDEAARHMEYAAQALGRVTEAIERASGLLEP
jgi:N-acetylated-alpha-linked acidic dipeptidase